MRKCYLTETDDGYKWSVNKKKAVQFTSERSALRHAKKFAKTSGMRAGDTTRIAAEAC